MMRWRAIMITIKAGNLHDAKTQKPGKLGDHDKGQNEQPEFGTTRPSGEDGVVPERIFDKGTKFHSFSLPVILCVNQTAHFDVRMTSKV